MFLDEQTYRRLIPKALLKARNDAGLTIEQVAAKTGISVPAIQNYEWGINLPLMSYFLSVLDAYGLNLGQFHDTVIDTHNNELREGTSKQIGDLEQRLSRLEQAARAETGVK